MPIELGRVAEGIAVREDFRFGAFPPALTRSGLLIDGFLEASRSRLLATALGVFFSIPIAFMFPQVMSPPKPCSYLGRGSSSLHAASIR